jgi:hypothetical protein
MMGSGLVVSELTEELSAQTVCAMSSSANSKPTA